MEYASGDEGDALPVLLFRVGSRLCALPLTHVVETMRPLPIEPFASASVAVRGLALIRGSPIPVVALSALLKGNDESDENSPRFVTVRTGATHVALAVSNVLGVHRIAAASLRDIPSLLKDADNDAVSAIGMADAELLLVLNAARLMPDGLGTTLNTAGM